MLELVLARLPVDDGGSRLHVHNVVAQLALPLVLLLPQAQQVVPVRQTVNVIYF